MDLRQLAVMVAIADHGTFSAAADALGTVQSNVSAHVARLERELGVTVFDRAAGRLTPEGVTVVDGARRVEAELDALLADVTAMRAEVTGVVRLGIIGTTARWLTPRLVEEMAGRHPRVRLVIVDATSTSLEPQLVAGALDLAVVNLPPGPAELVAEPLFEEELLLFVPARHPMARRSRVSMAELAEVELLLPPAGTAFRDGLDQAAREAGVRLSTRAEVDGLRLIASLVASGYGAAILPETAVARRVGSGTRALAVDGLRRRQVGVARRRRGLPGAAARALLEVLGDATPAALREARTGLLDG